LIKSQVEEKPLQHFNT